MKKNNYERMIIADIIDACNGYVEKETAVRAMRAVCRYFGGQLVYIPSSKTTGDTTKELYGIISDEVGDAEAQKIIDKMMALLGGYQIYIPMERSAFRDIIANEIYERYNGDDTKIGDLCREYGMSFTQVYRLWEKGRADKRQLALDFEGGEA